MTSSSTTAQQPAIAGPRVRRVGLIGDVHSELDRLTSSLEFFAGADVDAVLCTGDIADGPGCLETCVELLDQSNTWTVRGNHDRWLLQDRARHIRHAHHRSEVADKTLEWLEQLPRQIEFETPMGPVLLCHGMAANDLRKIWPGTERMPIDRSPELDRLIAEDRLRMVINGHMHYRVLIDFEALTVLNAGTLAGRHRPGFSIVDFDSQQAVAYEFQAGHTPQITAERLLRPHAPRRVWKDTQEFDGRWTPVTLYG